MTPGDTTQSAEFDDLTRRMEGALEVLKREFSGLRTGRASVHFLDPIMVEAYGQRMPLNQLATIGVPEPRMLTVQVWDRSMVKAVEKSIRQSDLGLNPQTDGQILRISLPDLSEDRRRELVRVAGKYAEQAKISVRKVRRDGIEIIRRQEKNSEISQDEQQNFADKIQK